MAFNIQEFKSKMDQYGGPARSNLFMVYLSSANSRFISSDDIRFFCKTVTLPSISLETIEIKQNAIGMPHSMPFGISNDAVECVFMLDSDHQVLGFFHEWAQNIVNYDVSRGNLAPNNNDPQHMPYEINYKKGKSGYALRMNIVMFSSNNAENYYECVLEDVYPKTIGAVNLSWEDNDTPATLPISFSYSSIKTTGSSVSSPFTNNSNGLGQIGYMETEKNLAQQIYQNTGQTYKEKIDQMTNITPFSLLNKYT